MQYYACLLLMSWKIVSFKNIWYLHRRYTDSVYMTKVYMLLISLTVHFLKIKSFCVRIFIKHIAMHCFWVRSRCLVICALYFLVLLIPSPVYHRSFLRLWHVIGTAGTTTPYKSCSEMYFCKAAMLASMPFNSLPVPFSCFNFLQDKVQGNKSK